MINVRIGVFETNSSSVHTMTITDENTYEKWLNKELLFVNEDERWSLKDTDWNPEKEQFVSKERATDLYMKIIENEYHPNFEEIFKTYFDWCDYWDDLYTYKENYTTKSGDKVVIFGKHGYCG